jgi:hypothetical protein
MISLRPCWTPLRGSVTECARFAHAVAAALFSREKLRHNTTAEFYLRIRRSPGRIIQRSSDARPFVFHSWRNFVGGSDSSSSVSLKVPQCDATNAAGLCPSCCSSSQATTESAGLICTAAMSQRGSCAPMGRIAASNGPKVLEMIPNSGCNAVSPAKKTDRPPSLTAQPHQSVRLRLNRLRPEKCWAGVQATVIPFSLEDCHQSISRGN